MRLKKLELYGFKSFASRTEILFGEGITGIVGPNGSGKSNIADAVRWVLGEQSPKTLRGANMSDVIFNGTQKRKALGYCEVSLVFDNSEHFLPMDFSEVMVTRRVYRNGDSDYFLNQSSCRLKDIIDLFRDTGIGKEGYSIIGQGRIDEILSRKSEDRRLIFEEAAGIVKFKARKEEAEKKLERTLDNASRIDDILEELSKQLIPLEEQSRTARQYLEWFDQLKKVELNLFLHRTDQYHKRLESLDEDIRNIDLALEQTQKTLQEKMEKRETVQSDIETLNTSISEQQHIMLSISERLHSLDSKIQAVQIRISTRNENKEQMMQDNLQATQKLSDLEEIHSQSQTLVISKKKEVAEADAALKAAREQLQNAQKEEEEANIELENHKEAVIKAIDRASAIHNNQTRLQTLRTQREERLHEVQALLANLFEKEKILQTNYEQSELLLQNEQSSLAIISGELEKKESFLEEINQKLNEVRLQYSQQSTSFQELQSRYHLLTEMAKEMEGYNQSVRNAIQYAKHQNMNGVHGVIGQMITVPQNLEMAIDMSLGNSVQNIVVDREETAKQLIDYLRGNKLGRATFLPMSAIRSKVLNSNERSVLSMQGCIGVASELIEYDPQYKSIMENLLGRTVIADNLDHGIAIMRAGHHAFRLVTLNGDVMHSGGSMTGGSVQSRMTNLLSREREIKDLEGKIKDARQKLEETDKAVKTLQVTKDTGKEDIRSITDRYHQQEISVARETERLQNSKNDLLEHRMRIDETRDAEEQLSISIEQINQQLDDIEHANEATSFDQDAMDQKTSVLTQSLQEKKNATALASKVFMDTTLHLSDLRHEMNTILHDSEHYEEEKQRLSADIQHRIQTLANYDKLDHTDKEEMDKYEVSRQQEIHNQEDQEVLIKSLEQKRSEEQANLRSLNVDIENMHQSETRDSDRKHRLELNHSRVENDLKQMTDRIWDTYNLTYGTAESFRYEEGYVEKEAEQTVKRLSQQIRELGSVNIHAVEEYSTTKARFDELSIQQKDLKTAEHDLRILIDQLIEEMKTTFVANFNSLKLFFSETFERLFGGGHAEIELTDPDDPLNCGIEVNAQPPGKKLQLLSLLSGGERALTAIAILFAMLRLKPTPFCILDEIEAALDDANIGYYADYLKEFSKDTQFIVITHRKGTMERCNALYGVAMEELGVSKMVSVSLQNYEE